jgi:DNA-binding transcriptional ArsR family regulator
MGKVTLEDTEQVFAALAHETRRRILLILAQLGGELPSGYLATRFQHSWPTTTRHLNVLEKAGLIEVRREGRSSFYRLSRERASEVLLSWLAHLEPVGPDRTWEPTGPRSTRALREPRAASTPTRKGRQR